MTDGLPKFQIASSVSEVSNATEGTHIVCLTEVNATLYRNTGDVLFGVCLIKSLALQRLVYSTTVARVSVTTGTDDTLDNVILSRLFY